MQLHIPYREARHGFWGDQTSTLNWCEEDYNVTFYCAELINTLTNFIFFWLGVKGIRDCLRYSHARVFIVCYAGYMVVGLGSMAFHATLKYSMQLADELPMIYTTCIMGFVTFTYKRSRSFAILVGLALFSLAMFITVYYYISKDPKFHQNAYALLTCTTVFRGMYIMQYRLRPALVERSPQRADQIMAQMWKMTLTGIGLFLVGFAIWNVDNIYCHHLRTWRGHVLLPWAITLEGHGWWHIFTGLGYYFITWRVWLQRCLDGDENRFALRWSSPLTSVPQVVPVSKIQNGSAKKTQ